MSFRVPQLISNEFSIGCMSLLSPLQIRMYGWQCPYFFRPLIMHSYQVDPPSQEMLQALWNVTKQVTVMIATISRQGISIERSISLEKGGASTQEMTKSAKKEAKALQKKIEKIFKRENTMVFICDKRIVKAPRFQTDLIRFAKLYLTAERELVDRKPMISTEVPEDDEKESLFSKCQRIWNTKTG